MRRFKSRIHDPVRVKLVMLLAFCQTISCILWLKVIRWNSYAADRLGLVVHMGIESSWADTGLGHCPGDRPYLPVDVRIGLEDVDRSDYSRLEGAMDVHWPGMFGLAPVDLPGLDRQPGSAALLGAVSLPRLCVHFLPPSCELSTLFESL